MSTTSDGISPSAPPPEAFTPSISKTPLPHIAIVVCSNRVPCIEQHLLRNLEALSPADKALLVLDTPSDNCDQAFLDLLRRKGVQLVLNNGTRGLAHSRNTAMGLAPCSCIIFLDDDVSITAPAVEAIRNAFATGAHIVGVRLQPPPSYPAFPFYITEGQWHYLGLHNPLVPQIKPWGGCLGIDVAFAARHSLTFREDLGRMANALASGDDTTFIEQMRKNGAKEVSLNSITVVHNLLPHRISFRYVLRRAFWQGRSEVRRSQFPAALKKEFRRNNITRCRFPLRIAVGTVTLSAFSLGAAYEKVIQLAQSTRNHTPMHI